MGIMDALGYVKRAELDKAKELIEHQEALVAELERRVQRLSEDKAHQSAMLQSEITRQEEERHAAREKLSLLEREHKQTEAALKEARKIAQKTQRLIERKLKGFGKQVRKLSVKARTAETRAKTAEKKIKKLAKKASKKFAKAARSRAKKKAKKRPVKKKAKRKKRK